MKRIHKDELIKDTSGHEDLFDGCATIVHDDAEDLFALISLDDLEHFKRLLDEEAKSIDAHDSGGGYDMAPRGEGLHSSNTHSKEESDPALELLAMATLMMSDDEARAKRWLGTPRSIFGGKTPLIHAQTKEGFAEVAHLIYRIRGGVII